MMHLLLSAVVTIENFAFRPSALRIHAGETVRFVNKDQEAHTITDLRHAFDSEGLDTGKAWTHRFTRAGTYRYFCELHPYMKATITVLPAVHKR